MHDILWNSMKGIVYLDSELHKAIQDGLHIASAHLLLYGFKKQTRLCLVNSKCLTKIHKRIFADNLIYAGTCYSWTDKQFVINLSMLW